LYCLFLDRKKDLVKLQLGEYVSLGKVEAQLKTCPVVENICVYGDPTKHYTVALVVPNQAKLNALAAGVGVTSSTFEDLCASPAVEKAVLKELEVHAKKCKYLELCANVYVHQLLLEGETDRDFA